MKRTYTFRMQIVQELLIAYFNKGTPGISAMTTIACSIQSDTFWCPAIGL